MPGTVLLAQRWLPRSDPDEQPGHDFFFIVNEIHFCVFPENVKSFHAPFHEIFQVCETYF